MAIGPVRSRERDVVGGADDAANLPVSGSPRRRGNREPVKTAVGGTHPETPFPAGGRSCRFEDRLAEPLAIGAVNASQPRANREIFKGSGKHAARRIEIDPA